MVENYKEGADIVYGVRNDRSADTLFKRTTANIFLIGAAYQAGLLPLKAESIEGAIELNGVAVQQNLQAFRYGRRYVHAPQAVTEQALPGTKSTPDERADMFERLGGRQARVYEKLLSRCGNLDTEAQRMLADRAARSALSTIKLTESIRASDATTRRRCGLT